jgi:hypothetical protein
MKKLLIITAVFALAITIISSCKKDITLAPLANVSIDAYFKSNKDLTAAIAGMYSAFQEETTGDGTGKDEGYGGRYHYWGEGRSDNFAPSQYFNTTITELANNGLTINNTATDWGGLYKTIFRANTIIKFAPAVPQYDANATQAIVNNALAQAYAMRAESYFYIVRLWGDAPIWTDPYLDITKPGEKARTPKAAVLDSITKDLQTAYTLIPKGATPSVWYINEGAICSILADVYMWRKDYANAKIWMENLFKARAPSGKVYSAAVGAPAAGDLEATANFKTNLFITPAASVEAIWSINWDNVSNGCACIPVSVGLSNNPVRVDSTFYFNWKKIKTDIRLTATLDTTAVPSSGLGKWDKVLKYYVAAKASDLTGTGTNSTTANLLNVNLTMYRLGDMFLLYAEAVNALGDKTTALKYLNAIRTRAVVPVIAATDPRIATTDGMEDVILQERQYETFGEGKRWFDLIRTGRVNTVMDPILKLRQITSKSPQVGFGADLNKILWPISRAALNANAKLVQNPSY